MDRLILGVRISKHVKMEKITAGFTIEHVYNDTGYSQLGQTCPLIQ